MHLLYHAVNTLTYTKFVLNLDFLKASGFINLESYYILYVLGLSERSQWMFVHFQAITNPTCTAP